jgi:hypothetical protein
VSFSNLPAREVKFLKVFLVDCCTMPCKAMFLSFFFCLDSNVPLSICCSSHEIYVSLISIHHLTDID